MKSKFPPGLSFLNKSIMERGIGNVAVTNEENFFPKLKVVIVKCRKKNSIFGKYILSKNGCDSISVLNFIHQIKEDQTYIYGWRN